MKKLAVLTNKGELLNFRKELAKEGYTEAKLIYRAGQYVLTYFTEKIDQFGLMGMGYIKPSKEFKAYVKENKIKVYGKIA